MVKGETAVIDQKRVKRLDKKKQALIGSQIKRKRMGFPAMPRSWQTLRTKSFR